MQATHTHRHRLHALCACALLLASPAACTREPEPLPAGPSEKTQATLLPAAPSAAVAPRLHHGIAWYEDAPDAALALARAEGKLVFVDLWAPWCHTCLSMKEYVLRDDKLPRAAEQYVFLAINTEKPENAQFLRTIPVQAWPTFYVLDAAQSTPQIRGRWVGAASPQQLMLFLRDAQRAHEAARAGTLAHDDPLALAIAGDQRFAAGDLEGAAGKYAQALSRAPADWPRRPDTLVSQISLLYKTKQLGACVDLGLSAMEQTGRAVSAADFSYYALSCADELEPLDLRVSKVRRAAETKLSSLCEAEQVDLTADDRGDACASLRAARKALNDKQGMKAAAATRLKVLENAAHDMPDEVALTYDWARAETLLWLDRGDEALGFLTTRERALPKDYNPPHYLARVYKELARWDDGLAAIDRALGQAYGPRKAAMLGLKADLLLAANRKDEAKRTLEAQLKAYIALPEGQQPQTRELDVSERLRQWK